MRRPAQQGRDMLRGNGAASLLPAGLTGFFDCLEVAERNLAGSQLTADKQQALFKHLTPSGFTTKAKRLYASHVQELVERAEKDEDLRPGTKAEIMLCLSETSLIAPLTGSGQLLYERLFAEVFPIEAIDIMGDGQAREPWRGSADELLEEMRRRTRKEDRRL